VIVRNPRSERLHRIIAQILRLLLVLRRPVAIGRNSIRAPQPKGQFSLAGVRLPFAIGQWFKPRTLNISGHATSSPCIVRWFATQDTTPETPEGRYVCSHQSVQAKVALPPYHYSNFVSSCSKSGPRKRKACRLSDAKISTSPYTPVVK
jgi:hypothetical protein